MDWEWLTSAGWASAWIVLGVVLLLIAKAALNAVVPFRVNNQLVRKDNPAVGLVVVAYLLGVTSIFVGAVIGPDNPDLTARDQGLLMLVVAAYTLGGAAALTLGILVVDKLILRRFSVWKELLEDRNMGTAAVVAGATLATAWVIAGAVHGEGGGWYSALIFFVLGQTALVLFAGLYQLFTRYDLHDEIERDNVAAGVAFGLVLMALGIVMLRAVSGELADWSDSLSDFAYYSFGGAVLMIFLQKVGDWVLLPGATLSKEIAQDQNLNAAWIEGGFALSVAVMVYVIW